MKILILGSVALPVPPPLQGGTERVAYWQARGLAARGHAVTLVAARGSRPDPSYALVQIGGGDTVSLVRGGLARLAESSRNLRKEAVYLAQVAQYLLDHGKEYDVILNNMRAGEAYFIPLAKSLGVPFTTVMHLPIFAELAELFRQYHTPVITISNAQRREFPDLSYAGTVYNGVEMKDFSFEKTSGVYLLMMGSIAPHKNQKTGIAVSRALGMPLILAGKIGNPGYYDKEIAPHIDGKNIRIIGEIGMEEKTALYKNAQALLFPVLWEEPFGLVMIEAMACGTPVVAFRRGAVPEVVVHGKTGFVVDNEQTMIDAVKKVDQIDRVACRKHVEDNFTNEKMIEALERALVVL